MHLFTPLHTPISYMLARMVSSSVLQGYMNISSAPRYALCRSCVLVPANTPITVNMNDPSMNISSITLAFASGASVAGGLLRLTLVGTSVSTIMRHNLECTRGDLWPFS